MNITDLSLEDRPREKFEAKGPGALSTAELLAILIGSGTSEENAVALMQRVMHSCDESLKALGKMSIKDLCKFKGGGTGQSHYHPGCLRTGQPPYAGGGYAARTVQFVETHLRLL